jgi:hypothetical protein
VKRSAAVLAATLLLTGLTGCTGFVAPVVPPTGFLYTSVEAPIDIDSDETQLGSKQGRSTSSTILGLVAWGDASTRAAAQAGGVTTIRHVDYEYTNVLSVYATFTTVVYGD